jgi:rubrerythrin
MSDERKATLDALKTAIQMEIDGKEFYLKASKASGNELGSKLLNKLAEEEDLHRQVFEKIYGELSASKGWPDEQIQHDGGRGLRNIFSMAVEEMNADVKSMPAEIDAVQKAMEMENKTFDFYRGRAARATHDAEKKFYQALSIVEEEHHRVLLEYYEFLKDPAAYFVQKEHPSLDGG